MTLRVKEAFKKRVEMGSKRPLLYALHDSFTKEFWIGGLCSLIAAFMQVLSPFLLRYLIQFATDAYVAHVSHTAAPHLGRGIGLTIGVTLMQVVQSVCISHFIYRGMMMGGQTRAVLIGMIYEKSMVISGRAKAGVAKAAIMPGTSEQEEQDKGKNKKGKKGAPEEVLGWGNGRITNLMSVDTYRVDQASALLHMTWTSPLSCIITLVLLLVNLTYSALAGFGLLIIGVPLITRAMQSLFRRRKNINKITDQRVSLTQEILQSVRFVKYFGWEKSFIDRLAQIRAKEIHSIQILLAIRNAINAVSISMPIFASMLSFITYSLTNHGLAPAEIFSSLALFNGLRIPLNLLPLVLGQVIDAWSSLQRIEQFLLEEEQEEDAILKPEGEHAIELVNSSFTWEKTPPKEADKGAAGKNKKGSKKVEAPKQPTAQPATTEDSASTLVEERESFKLQDLNLQAGRNELIAVIGTVGSGKSSLLAALAGDMRKTEGDVVFGASRAFCPQYAWIQNTTLQNNIVFGKEMNRKWYKEVIQA